MSDVIHDSRERLGCCEFQHVIGVLAFDEGETIDVETYSLRLREFVTGRRVKPNTVTANSEIAKSLRRVISDIDAAIQELTRQRERLSGLIPEEKPAPRRLLFGDEIERDT